MNIDSVYNPMQYCNGRAYKMTRKGSGIHTFYFERYAEVHESIAQKILAEAKNNED